MSPIPGLAASLPEGALEDVNCGFCDSAERSTKFTDGPFSVVTCAQCGLTYVTPRLTDGDLIDHVYNEGYWTSDAAKTRGYTDYRRDEPLYLKTYRRRLAVIKRHFSKPGRVLDIGCAAGFFLRVMRDESWQVTGLEPSEPIRNKAQQALGAGNVRAALLHEAGFEAGSFDLITLWDVLEHIPDPVAAISEARRLLAPGGKLLIETQNVNSRAAKVLGSRWQHYKHAEHIYHFNPETLAAILDRAGMRVLENTPKLGGKYVSLGFIAERAGRLHPALSLLLSPLKLLASASVYVNLFDEMIVVAAAADQPS